MTQGDAPDFRTLGKAGLEQHIATVTDLETLSGIDEWCASQGYSADGLTRCAILARRAELGDTLNEIEEDRVALATKRRAHGATLPPAVGKQGRGSRT